MPSRSGGLLLHVTSLPNRFGIGDLGPAAHRFVDFLERAGLRLWQLLPLGPTGPGASPYTSNSTFAGNPLLISPERLRRAGLLENRDLEHAAEHACRDHVAIKRVWKHKRALLTRAFERFEAQPGRIDERAFERFQRVHEGWLDDYVLFAALRETHGTSWTQWAVPLRRRDPEALRQARDGHARAIRRHLFWQFLFHRQWSALRAYAHRRGVRFFGDLPIYLAHDSADVWSHQDLFKLDENQRPAAVSGVPPDYFSETGQRWGNPLYRWDVMQEHGFAWWIARLRHTLRRVDLLRLDHFRGFEAYWQIPSDSATALSGHWEDGPGTALFDAAEAALGPLPLVAEDLGDIDDDVRRLMRTVGTPGMAILIFGLMDGPASAFLPHHHVACQVAYTGTHDNNTFAGWYADDASDAARAFARRYLGLPAGATPEDATRAGVRAVWASVADRAIVPMQDVLGLGSAARMNTPGVVSAQNWSWRLADGALAGEDARRRADWLADLAVLFDRETGRAEDAEAEEESAQEEMGKDRAAPTETERVA